MKLLDLDLNLLVTLDALLKYGSATVAARRLGVSQPTMSAGLSRLRATLGDPLFLKTASGLEPTARALELQEPVAHILQLVLDEVLTRSAFDPTTSNRCFTLVLGETGSIGLVQKVLPLIQRAAPNIKIRVISCEPLERQRLLEEGQADLAFGYAPQFSNPLLYQQRIDVHSLVCVLRKGHPLLASNPLSIEAFQAAKHAVLGTQSGYHLLYEPEFKRLGMECNVQVELPNLTGASYLLENTDLIAVLPDLAAQFLCSQGEHLLITPLPVPLPPAEVRQLWHVRTHTDPGLQWLRQLIANAMRPIKQETPAQPTPLLY